MNKLHKNPNIATFSIVGRSKDGKQIGVAVASKFLAVGSYVPAASTYGALATQANTNMKLRIEGMRMLESGMSAQRVLNHFFETDIDRDTRQAGMIDAQGGVATFTGDRCKEWAGGCAESHAGAAYTIQGNLLSGPEVIQAMAEAWIASEDETSLGRRLLLALEVGDNAGGDRRGRQASALYVVEKDKGFNGLTDVSIDLRCDDSKNPVAELKRLLALHESFFEG